MGARVAQLQAAVLVAFGCLALRLVHLQVFRGAHYRQLAEQNRLRLVPEPAPRGAILDARGRLLAANHTEFRAAVVPQELGDRRVLLGQVSQIVGRPVPSLERSLRREQTMAFLPATIVSHVPKETALRLEEARWQLPGLLVKAEVARAYPEGRTAAHVLGYLSQPTADELAALKTYGVRPRDLVGRMGLEKFLERALRGRSGGLMVEVDHRARQVRVIGRRPPEAGTPVHLTLDAGLQSLLEASFGAQPGAAVVLDPASGAVRAMVSQPGFDPQAFVDGDSDAVSRLLNDPAAPLLNRATMGAYQPGSVAKIVTAAAGLHHKVITPQTTIGCPGALRLGDRTFHCWNRDGHGALTLTGALRESCNVYFMQVARRLGAARLRAALADAGFGRRTGWLLEEQPGHIPQRRLTEGEVAILGIGQGALLVTVLQAAAVAGAFATDGELVSPWIVERVGERESGGRADRHRARWAPEVFAAVREGMVAVVRDPNGTGHRAFTPAIAIAAKTGTAQTHIPDRPHAWFVGYCPVEQPRLAFAIVAEHGGSGGDLPAEIARGLCEYAAAPGTL